MRSLACLSPVLVGLGIVISAGCAALVCIEGQDCEGGSGEGGAAASSSKATGPGGGGGGDAKSSSSSGGGAPTATSSGGGEGGAGLGGGGACADCGGAACEGTHCGTLEFSGSEILAGVTSLHALAFDDGRVYVGFLFNGNYRVAYVEEDVEAASQGSLFTAVGTSAVMTTQMVAFQADGTVAYVDDAGGVQRFQGGVWTQPLTGTYASVAFDGDGDLWGLTADGALSDGTSSSKHTPADQGHSLFIERASGTAMWSSVDLAGADCVADLALSSFPASPGCNYHVDPTDVARVGDERYLREFVGGTRGITHQGGKPRPATTTMPDSLPGFVAVDADHVYFDDASGGQTLVRRCPHAQAATDEGCETLHTLTGPLRGLEVGDTGLYFIDASTLYVIRK